MNIKSGIQNWLTAHNFITPIPASTIHYADLPSDLPFPIILEFDRLKTIKSGGYGMVFAVRDLYETTLKVVCLSVCYLMEADGDDSFCEILFSDKQMSFGDWVNALPSSLRKSAYSSGHPAVKNYLKKLCSFYNTTDIVRWRNDFIGHGLMSNPEDEDFFADVDDRINRLIDFLKNSAMPQEILSIDYADAAPFFFQEAGECYIYESVNQCGEVFYTNQSARRRTVRDIPYVRAKRKKYFAQTGVTQRDKLWEQEVYLSSGDEALDGYYLTDHYKKPDYMADWLNGCIRNNPCGVFLMQGARGTGKSSFSLACDELDQHGNQKIKISADGRKVSVRTYYCNRIDISNINDFGSYLSAVFGMLKNGDIIRHRGDALPRATDGLADFLAFYREQYRKFAEGDREKLLLIIDGIDELKPKGWDILRLIAECTKMPEGIYILLTCRSDAEQIPPVIADFLNHFCFTDRVDFDRRAENHVFMAGMIKEKLQTGQAEADRIASAFDDRLTVLPLLSGLSKDELDLIIGQQEDGRVSMEELAKAYLTKLELCYGRDYFAEFIRFIMVISEAEEGLTLNEISVMAFAHDITLREICFLKDASPLLQEFRSYRGNLYFVPREEYRNLLRGTYAEHFTALLGEWKAQLKNFDNADGRVFTETMKDVMLYYAAYLAKLQHLYHVYRQLAADDEETYKLSMNIYEVCHMTGLSDLVHRRMRALRGYATVETTLEDMMERGAEDERITVLILESASDAIYFAVNLREMDYAADVIERLERCIDNRRDRFYNDKSDIRFCLIRFYSCAMIRYCEAYDDQMAKRYYRKAAEALDSADLEDPVFKIRFQKIRSTLAHNYLGVLRNQDPASILQKAEAFLEEVKRRPVSFSRVNEQMMAAMCFKSAAQYDRSLALLSDTCEMAEEILEDRGMFWRDMLDPEEQIIYMSVYWRRIQGMNDEMKKSPDAASFAEMKTAIGVLDEFIGCTIKASQLGYGHLDFIRINMMTTAALLRNMIAYKAGVFRSRKDRISWAPAEDIERYREEAFSAVKIIMTAYENLDKAHVRYNRIDAVFNQMNCACIYAGFGEMGRAVELLEGILSGFVPENEQERMVYGILENKLLEFKMCG